jgi:hypothetical protein
VNLIPTPQGGTHVNGLRQGLLDAMREFCEFRNLLPRGVKLTPEDIWDRCAYILSIKMQDPQFAGQTKERLSSRQSSAFVSGVVKDAFSLFLTSNTELAEQIGKELEGLRENTPDPRTLWALTQLHGVVEHPEDFVALGWAWLRLTSASVDRRDDAFFAAKLDVARYFFARELPKLKGHLQAALSGADVLMAMADDQI